MAQPPPPRRPPPSGPGNRVSPQPPPRPPPPSSIRPPPPPPAPSSSQVSSKSSSSSSPSVSSPSSNPKGGITFDENSLPSRQDGISSEKERELRHRTCRFIQQASRILRLHPVAVATAMVFFHRFYAKHSFEKQDRFEVAYACILLAAKTEESPKRLSDVIQQCYMLKKNGGRKDTKVRPLDKNSEEYLKLKERVLLLERITLHTIAFELSIDHNLKHLVDTVHKLSQNNQIQFPLKKGSNNGDEQTASNSSSNIKDIINSARRFSDESLFTSLCLQFSSKKIAAACIYMSSIINNVKPTDGDNRSWLELLDVDADELFCKLIPPSMSLMCANDFQFFSHTYYFIFYIISIAHYLLFKKAIVNQILEVSNKERKKDSVMFILIRKNLERMTGIESEESMAKRQRTN